MAGTLKSVMRKYLYSINVYIIYEYSFEFQLFYVQRSCLRKAIVCASYVQLIAQSYNVLNAQ